ncbi:MAG: zinc ribbon domain-containing protein [Chloroflexi bacterium]|nr:zinc ribbon domain-containing protein [Chloroflexota bacterium]
MGPMRMIFMNPEMGLGIGAVVVIGVAIAFMMMRRGMIGAGRGMMGGPGKMGGSGRMADHDSTEASQPGQTPKAQFACPACGADVQQGWKACPQCGQPLV